MGDFCSGTLWIFHKLGIHRSHNFPANNVKISISNIYSHVIMSKMQLFALKNVTKRMFFSRRFFRNETSKNIPTNQRGFKSYITRLDNGVYNILTPPLFPAKLAPVTSQTFVLPKGAISDRKIGNPNAHIVRLSPRSVNFAQIYNSTNREPYCISIFCCLY